MAGPSVRELRACQHLPLSRWDFFSLTQKYYSQIADEGVCKEVNIVVNKEEARILFIDHKDGEISLDTLLSLYTPDAFIVVMAVDDRSTLYQAQFILSYLTSEGLLLTKPAILVSNKTDLVRNRVIKQSGQWQRTSGEGILI